MRLLLTLLSVLTGWAALGLLLGALLAILKPLERIRRSLEQITMGVRAIEKQAQPLGTYTETLESSLSAAGSALGATAQRLRDVDRNLDAALPRLRSR